MRPVPGRRVLAALSLIVIDDPIVATASSLLPRDVRSLDAIHIASALELGSDLGVLISYDTRMLAAARTHRLPHLAPGAGA